MSRFFKRVTTTFLGLVLAIFMVLNTTPYSLKVEATDLMEGIESNNVEGKTVDGRFVEFTSNFSIEMFKRSFDDENTLVSPLSIMLALCMTANGADEGTLAQIEKVLGDGTKIGELNRYLLSYAKSLPNEPKSKFKISNSIWFKEGFHVERDFLQTNADYYNANCYRSPFDEQTLKDINNWVKHKTDGMIECSSDMIREHYKYERQVCDLFKEDLAAMNELPAIDFDACKFVFAKTDKYGRAKFETNLYSTSSYYGQSEVMLQVSAMSVRILNANSELIVEHPRLYGKNQESIKWETYLPLIAKRPKALKYTMFYEELPEETREFFKQVDLPDAQKALKFFAERAEIEGYEKAMEFFNKAITLGANSSESIQAAYRYIIDPVLPEANIETNVKFPKHAEYKVDLQAYMSLVRERGVDNEQAKNNT